MTSQVIYPNVKLMPKIKSQRGVISPIVIAVVALSLIGVVFLISKKPAPKPSENPQPTVENSSKTPSIEWETYKDEEFGYSLDRPKGWIVENVTSDKTRIIKVSAPDKTVFVLIEGIAGPALDDEKAMEEVVDYLENELRNKEGYKVINSAKKTEGGLSGYLAEGENTSGSVTTWFEERFKVAKNGRGIRMHAGYPVDLKETNQKITGKIMDSFKTD